MSSNNQKEKEEEKKIIQPGVGMGKHFMMDSSSSKLEHSRRELWK